MEVRRHEIQNYREPRSKKLGLQNSIEEMKKERQATVLTAVEEIVQYIWIPQQISSTRRN